MKTCICLKIHSHDLSTQLLGTLRSWPNSGDIFNTVEIRSSCLIYTLNYVNQNPELVGNRLNNVCRCTEMRLKNTRTRDRPPVRLITKASCYILLNFSSFRFWWCISLLYSSIEPRNGSQLVYLSTCMHKIFILIKRLIVYTIQSKWAIFRSKIQYGSIFKIYDRLKKGC